MISLLRRSFRKVALVRMLKGVCYSEYLSISIAAADNILLHYGGIFREAEKSKSG